jgi:S1-C subfamily serine protease
MDMNKKNDDKSEINFELVDFYSPKEFILINDRSEVGGDGFLSIFLPASHGSGYRLEKKLARKIYFKIRPIKIIKKTTAIAVTAKAVTAAGGQKAVAALSGGQKNDLAKRETDIEKFAPKRVGRRAYSGALRSAAVIFLVLAFFLTGALANRLYNRYYDEGIDAAKKTIPAVVRINDSAAGVIIKEVGGRTYIVTNFHVISGGGSPIRVTIFGEDTAVAGVYVASEKDSDLTLIYIERTGLRHAEVCKDSVPAQFGQKVYAVGNPHNSGISITEGIISQTSVLFDDSDLAPGETSPVVFRGMALKFDAAINGGNSGGGLFNKRGQLIGIVFARLIPSNNENVAFAIPIASVIEFYDEFI